MGKTYKDSRGKKKQVKSNSKRKMEPVVRNKKVDFVRNYKED